MPNVIEDKKRATVEQFRLGILGGTFTVMEVIIEDDQTAEDALNLIQSTASERWFVILADSEGTTQDVLALIDDEYEFQFVALGDLASD